MFFSDNIKINCSSWFSALEIYPQTVEQFTLLVKMLDHINIFENFEINKIVNMDSDRINILLATLIISANLYNNCDNYISTHILTNFYKKIFLSADDNDIHQLIQDGSNFVGDIMRDTSRKISNNTVTIYFIRHIKTIISSEYYDELVNRTSGIASFIDNNIDKYVEQIVMYMSIHFIDDCKSLENIAQCIFSSNVSTANIINMFNDYIIKNNINVKNTITLGCAEIELYKEQIENIFGEIEPANIFREKISKNIKTLTNNTGYIIPDTVWSSNQYSLYDPFIINGIAINEESLIKNMHYIMIEYKKNLISVNNKHITIEKLYNMHKKKFAYDFINYDNCCHYLNVTNAFPKYVTVEFIYHILSLALNVKIQLYNNSGIIMTFNNSHKSKHAPINIYICKSSANFIYLTMVKKHINNKTYDTKPLTTKRNSSAKYVCDV